MRASSSMSPAAWAWKSADSGSRCASYQAAARRWSTGTRSGSCSSSSRCRRSRKRWWYRYQPRWWSSWTRNRFARSISSSSRRRALAAQHRVAERRAHALEDGRAPEEAEDTRLEAREVLGAAGSRRCNGRRPPAGSTPSSRLASAASRRPAAQPSVRWRRPASSVSSSSTPDARSRISASRRLSASS